MKNPGHGKNYTRRPEYLRNTTKERIDAAGHSGVEDAAAAILLNDFDYEIESDSESSEPEIDNEQIELEIEKEREIVLDN